jgi:hypothetical protein
LRNDGEKKDDEDYDIGTVEVEGRKRMTWRIENTRE